MTRDYKAFNKRYKKFLQITARMLKEALKNIDEEKGINTDNFEYESGDLEKEIDYHVKQKGMETVVKEWGLVNLLTSGGVGIYQHLSSTLVLVWCRIG